MFLKNMTDYVYSGRCALFINAGPRWGPRSKAQVKSQINSADQGPDQDQQQSRTRPAVEGAAGKSAPHHHRQLGKYRSVKGSLRPVLARSRRP